MSTRAVVTAPPPERRSFGSAGLVVGLGAALVVGAATGLDTNTGLTIACLIGLIVAATFRPASIAQILLASVFLEVIAFGGVSIARLLAPVALYIVVLEVLRGGASLRLGLPLVGVTAYATWALASGIWSLDSGRTLFMLGSLAVALAYMVGIATLIRDERDLRLSLVVLGLMVLFVGVYSVAGYAGLGPGGALEEGRAQGGLTSPNYFASLLVVALPLIPIVAAEVEKQWLRYLLYGSSAVALGSILTTVSRSGLFALLVLLLAMAVMPSRSLFPSPRYKAAVLLVLLLGVGFFMSRPHLRYSITDRVISLFASQSSEAADPSGAGRTELWKAARHSIAERPLLGLGFGAFYGYAPQLLRETPGVQLQLVSVEQKEVHNAYLGTATELGIPGLAFFLTMLVTTAVALRRTARKARRLGAHFVARVANGLLLSLMAWAVTAFFIEAETARPLWIIVGFSLALPKLVETRERARAGPPSREAPAASGP